jgi:hypothetical protein
MNPYNTHASRISLPKDNSRRSYLIFKLQRDWPAMRLGLRNGRSLNRLSTKQLEAKVRQHERMMDKQRSEYIKDLHSPARQQHLTRFVAAHNISLLSALHLVGAA